MKLTLNKIIKTVAKGYYSRDIFLRYWDPKTQRPRDDPMGGDLLAACIIREIYETYDSNTAPVDNIKNTIKVLSQAGSDIAGCIDSLKILQMQLEKKGGSKK